MKFFACVSLAVIVFCVVAEGKSHCFMDKFDCETCLKDRRCVVLIGFDDRAKCASKKEITVVRFRKSVTSPSQCKLAAINPTAVAVIREIGSNNDQSPITNDKDHDAVVNSTMNILTGSESNVQLPAGQDEKNFQMHSQSSTQQEDFNVPEISAIATNYDVTPLPATNLSLTTTTTAPAADNATYRIHESSYPYAEADLVFYFNFTIPSPFTCNAMDLKRNKMWPFHARAAFAACRTREMTLKMQAKELVPQSLLDWIMPIAKYSDHCQFLKWYKKTCGRKFA